MWVLLGIVSAFGLGVYDVAKKVALRDNAVLAVITLANIAGFLTLLPILAWVHFSPEAAAAMQMQWQVLTFTEHAHCFLKAMIVNTSWVFAYCALKYLPLSIVAPIRASGPVWTLIGALIIFGERPDLLQWIGLIIILISYFAFSLLGSKEGIHFKSNKWVWCIFLATMIGTISTLYDKYLIVNIGMHPFTLQFWFSLYLALIMLVLTAVWWWPRRQQQGFTWRWSIPCIGALLVFADFLYFRAITDPDALIIILSALRRSSVVISFVLGAYLFKEHNPRQKGLALAGVLAGVLCILLSN